MVGVYLTSIETAKLLSKMAMPCHILPVGHESSIPSTSSLSNTICLFELNTIILRVCRITHLLVFNLYFLVGYFDAVRRLGNIMELLCPFIVL